MSDANVTGGQQPTGAGGADAEEDHYSGFWRRVLAYLIDFALLAVVYWIVAKVVGVSMLPPDMMEMNQEELAAYSAKANLTSLIMLVINWLYFAGFETWGPQATPGKMALGAKVCDLRGNRIGFGRASIRFWGKIVSALILCIGFLMVAFTARKQGLHDMMAGCLVVQKPG